MVVVGIAGGSGSGKTTIIQAIQENLGAAQVAIISQDDYYLPIEKQARDPRGEVNFDLPDSIDSAKLLRDVKTIIGGEPISISRYTFNNPEEAPRTFQIEARPILIVEGLFVFHYPELAKLLDMKIFIETSEDLRLQRRIERDAKERGYPEQVVRYQWEHHVQPAYENYLLPYRTEADLLIDNEQPLAEAIAPIMSKLTELASI